MLLGARRSEPRGLIFPCCLRNRSSQRWRRILNARHNVLNVAGLGRARDHGDRKEGEMQEGA